VPLAAAASERLANEQTHVHIERGASRLRSDASCAAGKATSARLHWWPLVSPPDPYSPVVDIVDALAHAIRCQPPRYAIATLDSALNKLLITRDQLDEVFRAVPRKYGALRGLIDGRAESGPETLVRLIARSLGCVVYLQVQFDGIGRVDIVLDGWLVVECDSREFHADWAAQVSDRRRDVALAARGYVTVRFTAGQIMWQPELVQAALRGLLAAHVAEL
jgi:very-short-patch-repair endonuclease